MTNIQQTTFNF